MTGMGLSLPQIQLLGHNMENMENVLATMEWVGDENIEDMSGSELIII